MQLLVYMTDLTPLISSHLTQNIFIECCDKLYHYFKVRIENRICLGGHPSICMYYYRKMLECVFVCVCAMDKEIYRK